MHGVGRAFAPCAISSFFEPTGAVSDDPLKRGARGGGFVINKGVYAEVEASESDRVSIDTLLNGEIHDSFVAKRVIEKMMGIKGSAYHVVVRQRVDAPIGAGFGTSGASAVAVGLAAAKALRLPLTYLDVGRIAHVSEVECGTGLGTVIGVMTGGIGLVVKPGAPGIGMVDRLLVDENIVIVAGFFRGIRKSDILFSESELKRIRAVGRKTMERILDDPTLENFFEACNEFMEAVSFATERVRRLVEEVKAAGAIGATQNMIGEAVHAAVCPENLKSVLKVFHRYLPEDRVLVAGIDHRGARLL